MEDPMGGSPAMTTQQELALLNGLHDHPASFVLFIYLNNMCIGLATCFINFSTFKAKPYLNIHDIIISSEFRGKGLGKNLLQKIIEIANERGYCKVTLEVRVDNTHAKTLYQNLGFKDTEPVMHFWTKTL
jgi:ribosomal protein S18 acetylase RimI-like enzyme